MAFLVQHGASRAISAKAAAARERKARQSTRAAAKNTGKVEPGHGLLALARLLAACLLAPAVCICVVKLLLPVLSSRAASSGNGVYQLIKGNLVSSDDAEGVGSVNSWQLSMDVPAGPSAPILPRSGADPFRSSLDSAVIDIEIPKTKSEIHCDDKSKDEGFPYARPIVCQMSGDVRVAPGSSSVALTIPMQQSEDGRRIRPYARQDDSLLPLVREVVIRAAASDTDAPKCSVSHDVPAVIFSIGGYTGNFFHDMSDVLIPLYLTSFQFKGRVEFLITNYKQWWIQKYKPMLRRLSHYDIIDFESNMDVHCFQHVTLGLVRDRDLILRRHPTRNPKGYSMLDFTRFLRHSYGLRRDRPLVLGEQPGKKPRMLIISRQGTRKLLNLRRVAAMSRALGFDVIVSEAGGNVKRFATTVNSCDVLLAVHGAGLTNQVFLPAQAVVIQIVPWGTMDWMATNFYGEPARGMNLKYLEYYISEEESSLAQRYPRDHMVFKDPMAIHGQGWKALADVIMTQDVKIILRRFRPTLLQALDLLQV